MSLKLFMLVSLLTLAKNNVIRGRKCPELIALNRGPDNRGYFMDNTAKYTWHEARERCWNCGYELADFSNFGYNDPIIVRVDSNNINTLEMDRELWTGARESRDTPHYFKWDSTEKLVENTQYLKAVDGTASSSEPVPYYICGLYMADFKRPLAWLVAQRCSEKYHILCQDR